MNLTPEQLAKIGDPNHPIMQVMERLSQIEATMMKNDPQLKGHLLAIWKEMQQYEELAHLLTPEQIGVLMRGMQKYTAVQLVTEAPKKTKKAAKVDVSDLI